MWLAVSRDRYCGRCTPGLERQHIFTTVSDMFPKSSTASVTGIGGMAGGFGGIALSLFVQKNMFVYYRSIDKIESRILYHVWDLRQRLFIRLAYHALSGTKDEEDRSVNTTFIHENKIVKTQSLVIKLRIFPIVFFIYII
jgi:hypothetical protein